MFRYLLVMAMLFATLPAVLCANDYPKAEVYGGYQWLRETGEGGTTLNGFLTSAEVNINEVIGIAGEFGLGLKKITESGVDVNIKQYTYMGGPRFNLRANKIRFFTQFLAGGNSINGGASTEGVSVGATIKGFAFSVGGGLDFSVGNNISIRPVQLDYIATRLSIAGISGWEKQVRYSGGIVFKFGTKK